MTISKNLARAIAVAPLVLIVLTAYLFRPDLTGKTSWLVASLVIGACVALVLNAADMWYEAKLADEAEAAEK
jgi:hypothetical protein